MFTAICEEVCTTPEHGYVEEGQRVEFSDIDEWDPEKYPHLKRFKKTGGKGVQMEIEPPEQSTGSSEPEETLEPETDEDPVVAALGKRVHAMGPDELDKTKSSDIGKAYGISYKGRKKDDVVADALKIDTHGEA